MTIKPAAAFVFTLAAVPIGLGFGFWAYLIYPAVAGWLS